MRLLSRATAIGMGLLTGLLLTELIFTIRDRAAFPHLNLYLPDDELGVRLMPSSRERIAFGGNPTSTVRVNDRGYRGAAWPPPASPSTDPTSPREILVVGDSQVFGLGVEDDETHPARLAVHTGRPVINGGVPTYGPREYLAAADEILSERDSIDTLVVVFNFSNDLFEVDRPNRERHTVWDGWAVRIETAPDSVTWFPGRAWLYRNSHAFFALRRAWHLATARTSTQLPSEGIPLDVVMTASQRSVTLHEEIEEKSKLARKLALSNYQDGVASLGGEGRMLNIFGRIANNEDVEAVEAYISNKQPGDIVGNPYVEGARPVEVTAEMLARGAQLRSELAARLRQWAEENPERASELRILGLLRMGRTLDPLLAGEAIPDLPLLGSPLDAVLDEAVSLADSRGVKLVVVALPLDVQVSASQWQKYGLPTRDMSQTHLLLDDLGLSCTRRGVRFLNALPALAELGDEAFLKADLHLTPAGQDQLARAIAQTIDAPAPIAPPPPGLPEGRSRIPSWDEWAETDERVVRGSSRNRCETLVIREWLKIECETLGASEGHPRLGAVSGPFEIFGWRANDDSSRRSSALYVPLLAGREVSARFLWSQRSDRLTVTWKNDRPIIAFVGGDAADDPGEPLPETLRAGHIAPGLGEMTFYGTGPADCAQSYPKQDSFVRCTFGERSELPDCAQGFANAGSAGHCLPLCSASRPCASGVCTPWLGSAVCL